MFSQVFCNTFRNAMILFRFLFEQGWPVTRYVKGQRGKMGARFQDARKFATGQLPLMIATEHAGRGLDWVDVSHVVLFEMGLANPPQPTRQRPENHVHLM